MNILRSKKDSAPAAPQRLQFVTFQIGAEEFCLPISCITEVIRPLPVTALPKMPQFVEGVINLRGSIIPVVDLRKRFGLQVVPVNVRTCRMIITRGATGSNALLGLIVDAVREVIQIPAASVEPAPEAATGSGADFIAGVVKTDKRMIILIDISKILTREERTKLSEAGNVRS